MELDRPAGYPATHISGASILLRSGCSAARLARLLRKQEVGSSNLPTPTNFPSLRTILRPILRRSAALSAFVFLCLLVAPLLSLAESSSPATYKVRKGDNLTVIAQRFGTTVKTLKSDNNLRSDVIHVGQALQVSHPFRGQDNKRVQWGRPMRHPGPVLRPFGPYQAGGILMPRTGTDLATPVGTSLYSPAIGVVRHSGPMDGFGHILIIEHPGRYATVLAPCDPVSLTVEVGQAILRGEPLGKTGSPPETGAQPFVHLELRRDDKAIAPDRLIK